MSIDRHPSASAPTPPSRWLLPVLVAGERTPAQLDRLLSVAATAAAGGDTAARDALYHAFAPRLAWAIGSEIRRLSGRGDDVVEADDIVQEGYLAFIDLIARWQGDGPLTAYVTGLFPRRLRRSVARLRHGAPVLLPPPLDDDRWDDHEALAMLEELAAPLNDRQCTVLMARIAEGQSLAAIARRLGLNRRTVHRDWQIIAAVLRPQLERDRSD